MRAKRLGPAWNREEFFPIVAEVIEDTFGKVNRFVRRDEIASGLSESAQARALLSPKILDSEAGNIVDWFSSIHTQYKNGRPGALKWEWLLEKFEQSEILGRKAYRPFTADRAQGFADEVDPHLQFQEGAVRRVVVNAYERNPQARRKCLDEYGSRCFICKLSFGETYGPVADGFIHVHHLRELSEIRRQYTVDALKDLRPVCPNCHSVLHLRSPAYSIEEVLVFLQRRES